MEPTKSGSLPVPGANLYYEVRGSGPLLLLIAGGDGGREGYSGLADQLASHYSVITYDRRGSLHSPLDDPNSDVRLEMHSDDAHHLLAVLTTQAALVFGSSAGALIGLDLAIRYPEQVGMLIAHEPPVEGLLPEFDRFQEDFLRACLRGEGAPALMRFMAQLGVNFASLEPGVELPAGRPQDTARRAKTLFDYTFQAVHRYRLDIAALSKVPARIVLAAGSDSRGKHGYNCAAAVAGRLGTGVVEFPSHHSGYISHPRAFAARLREVIEEL